MEHTQSEAETTDDMARLRREIDEIDRGLIDLLKRRFELVQLIGEHKKGNGIAIRDAQREGKVIESLTKYADSEILGKLISQIYPEIFEASREVQSDL